MTPQKENIKILFQGGRTLTPMYDREYERLDTGNGGRLFLEHLYEATKGNKNPPFFGIIVLQKSNKDEKIIIVDGLKRITTLVIFVRAMLNILQKRAQKEQLDTRVKKRGFFGIH